MESQSSASIVSYVDHNYDNKGISRRSVDWRDSGIVIDDEHQFISIEGLCDFNLNTNSSTSSGPLEKIVYDQDDDGDTFLHLAVVGCTVDKVKDLIKICDLDSINNMMQTPLHVATLAYRPEMVELLISNGAKLNVHDRRGNTPLHLACQKGYKNIVTIICEFIISNQSSGGSTIKEYVEMTNFDGQTSLHLAALHDKREIIELLVTRYEADLNCRDSRSGDTILHKAILNFNVELVDFILKLGKHCHKPDYSGRRPSDTIKILLNSVANKSQSESLLLAAKLLDERIKSCIETDGCCAMDQYKQLDDQMLDSSSSSDYSDSDSDIL